MSWKLWRILPRKSTKRRAIPRLAAEQLEVRTLFTATPIGDVVSFYRSSSLIQDRDAPSAIATLSPAGTGITVFQGISTGSQSTAGNSDIFLRRLDASGQQVGALLRVNDFRGGDQEKPASATDEDGNALIVWSGPGQGDLQGVFARRFLADGTFGGPEFRVNSRVSGQQFDPAVAMNSSGNAVVVWHGSSNDDAVGVYFRRLDAAGQPIGTDTLVNTTISGEQSHAAVAIDDAGNFVVVWTSRGNGADGRDIFLQRFAADGTRQGTETRVNSTALGSQHHAVIDRAGGGEFVVAWNSFAQDGDGWGVFSQRFDAQGARLGTELRLNQSTAGHQKDVSLALSESGEVVAAWSHGVPNGSGWEIQAASFDADDALSGLEFLVNQTTSGPNSGDQRFPNVSLDSEGTSLISFQGGTGVVPNSLLGRRYTVDIAPAVNVAPQLASISNRTVGVGQQLEVEVTATDRNRNDDLTFTLAPGESPAGATITRVDDRRAVIRWTPGVAERGQRVAFRVLVDDSATPPLGDAVNFTVDVQNAPPVVDSNGTDSGTNSTVQLPTGQSQVTLAPSKLTISDLDNSQLVSATATIKAVLDGTSESLSAVTAGTSIQASYDNSTGVLQLTGSDTLVNYQQVLRSLTYRNTATTPAGTQRRIEMIVNDGTSTSAIAEVIVTFQNSNNAPTLNAIPTQTVLAGSPFVIPLDGEDLDNDALTYSVTSSNPQIVTAVVPTGNRSLRLSVANFGDMVFELYEDKAARATSQIIALANEGFYNGIIFHRVVNNFVIQAGDPTGTGTSGSNRPDFDDQFDLDLQHNRSGILSMAKTTDDTNNSQFFVTEGPTRHLDFNHTIFGQLVEGEAVREAISNVAVNSSSKPLTDVRIQSAQVFNDVENRVLRLRAPHGVTGQVTIDVQVSDGRGGTVTRQFTVNVVPDNQDTNSNSQPFLDDIPAIVTSKNVEVTRQLRGRDVEGDTVFFLDEAALEARNLRVPVAAPANLDVSVNPNTGLLTITPRNDITGTFRFTVAVASSLTGLTNNSPIDYQVVSINIVDPT